MWHLLLTLLVVVAEPGTSWSASDLWNTECLLSHKPASDVGLPDLNLAPEDSTQGG